MSVPVQDWLLDDGRLPKSKRPPPFDTERKPTLLPPSPPHAPPKRSARREIPVPNQPLEPILIASLRIYFADFPYLHSSIKLEALHLGDLLRLSVRPPTTNGTNNAPITPSDFQGPPNARRTPQTKKVAWCSAELPAQSPAKLIPGPESSSMPHKIVSTQSRQSCTDGICAQSKKVLVKKKRKLFPGHSAASPSLLALPLKIKNKLVCGGPGILTWFPFDGRG